MADFKFFLNRQGVKGETGAKGEKGDSPSISIKTATANEYVLTITNPEQAPFDTPNLIGGNYITEANGSYVRYNQATEEFYADTLDYATTNTIGGVTLCDYATLSGGGTEGLIADSVNVYNLVDSKIAGLADDYVAKSTYETYVDNTAITLNSLSTEKLDFSDLSNSLVAGDNVTLTVDSVNNTITIDSTGGSFTQVQADWDESDSSDPSYIKNKPTLGTMAEESASDYTKTSDLASVATSGDYDDLLNTPTLGTMAEEAASDYSKTSDFATVAFSGSYGDLLNTPSIPAAQVQADWSQADSGEVDYIKNKPTIPSAANDATITITQGGVTKGSFTTNQSSDATIALDAGGGTSLSGGNGIDVDQADKINIVQDESYTWSDLTVAYGTMTDGVLDGIASQSNISETVSESVVGCIDFTTGSAISSGKRIYSMYESYGVSAEISTVTGSNRIKTSLYPNGSSGVSYYGYLPAAINTHYAVFFRMDKTAAVAWMVDYTNNTVSTFDLTKGAGAHALASSLPSQLWLGANSSASSGAFGGTIDTNKSYIMVDDAFIHGISASTEHPAKSGANYYGLIKSDNSTIRVSNGIINTDLTYLTTAAQMSAINSGITSTKVSQITTNKDNITTIQGNYVKTDTVQDISARKTFLGEKAIYFKQTSSTNKMGFTMYDSSNNEMAGLEYRPNTISGAALLTLNAPQATGNYVGFRYWGNPATNIIASKPTTAGDYYIPVKIVNGTTNVTANSNGVVDISSLLPMVPEHSVQSLQVTNIVSLTQSAYDTLVSQGQVDTDTFYIIIPANNS